MSTQAATSDSKGEEKKLSTFYGYPDSIKSDVKGESKSILRIALEHFPTKIKKTELQQMTLEREKHLPMFDRMLKTDTQEGMEAIPDRFFDYTFQVTDTHIEFVGTFDNVCRAGFGEFYYSLFPKESNKLMLGRRYDYFGYERKADAESADDIVMPNIFGEDLGDY